VGGGWPQAAVVGLSAAQALGGAVVASLSLCCCLCSAVAAAAAVVVVLLLARSRVGHPHTHTAPSPSPTAVLVCLSLIDEPIGWFARRSLRYLSISIVLVVVVAAPLACGRPSRVLPPFDTWWRSLGAPAIVTSATTTPSHRVVCLVEGKLLSFLCVCGGSVSARAVAALVPALPHQLSLARAWLAVGGWRGGPRGGERGHVEAEALWRREGGAVLVGGGVQERRLQRVSTFAREREREGARERALYRLLSSLVVLSRVCGDSGGV